MKNFIHYFRPNYSVNGFVHIITKSAFDVMAWFANTRSVRLQLSGHPCDRDLAYDKVSFRWCFFHSHNCLLSGRLESFLGIVLQSKQISEVPDSFLVICSKVLGTGTCHILTIRMTTTMLKTRLQIIHLVTTWTNFQWQRRGWECEAKVIRSVSNNFK